VQHVRGKSEIITGLWWRNLRERGPIGMSKCGRDDNIKVDREEIKLESGLE